MKKAIFSLFLILSTYGYSDTSQTTTGSYSPTISDVRGSVTIDNSSNINIYEKDKKDINSELLIPNNKNKNLPHDILEYIYLGAPLSRVKEILGSPFRESIKVESLFDLRKDNKKNRLYTFDNYDMLLEFDSNETVTVITIEDNYNDHLTTINIPPFSATTIGKIEIGKSKIDDLGKFCGYTKSGFFDTYLMRYFATECYFEDVGNSNYFTFGALAVHQEWEVIKDNKLIITNNNEPNLKSDRIGFVSISKKENYGHMITTSYTRN